jgi:2-keto-3-deoxy-L-rhamnonate aldolase RhmA
VFGNDGPEPWLGSWARKRTEGDETILGRREVIDVLALAGVDFAICDLEHSQITEAEAGTLIVAGRSCDLAVIVRVAHFDPGQINRLLEAGAAGIQLPQVQTREQVAAFGAACKYPPAGSRSVSLAQPAASYGSEPLAEYLERSNREVLLVGQMETRELQQPLPALLNGLDVAFIGSLDLTVDMGVPGRLEDPAVQQRLREIERAALTADIHLGIYADAPPRAAQAAAAGYRMIALSSDLGALAVAVKSWTKRSCGDHDFLYRSRSGRPLSSYCAGKKDPAFALQRPSGPGTDSARHRLCERYRVRCSYRGAAHKARFAPECECSAQHSCLCRNGVGTWAEAWFTNPGGCNPFGRKPVL